MKFDPYNFTAADHKVMRFINRSNILNMIREKGPISRADISKLVGIKKPAVSSIVKELIDQGLVYEDGRGKSSVGRRPIVLRINERGRTGGVIDVRRRETVLAICDLGKNVLDRKVIDTTAGDGKEFFSFCGKTISEMADLLKCTLSGVGISVPALVDHNEGIIYKAYSNNWNNVNVRQLVEEQVGCSVSVENDAKAGAIAELWFGEEARDLSDFAFILVCEGIGVGLVFNRSLYHGAHSLAGEFGKQLISDCSDYDNSSGNLYWENKASDLSVVERYKEYSGNGININGGSIEQAMQQVINLAHGDNEPAVRALKETARYLGIGLANMHSGFDPEKIIVGGKIVQAWGLIEPIIATELEKYIPHKQVDWRSLVVPSTLSSPTFDGAQAMIHREIFKSINVS